jgi:hypothetical protein
MQKISQETRYEVSLTEIKEMYAGRLNVDEAKITLIPHYTYPDYDGPGVSQRDFAGFTIIVKED